MTTTTPHLVAKSTPNETASTPSQAWTRAWMGELLLEIATSGRVPEASRSAELSAARGALTTALSPEDWYAAMTPALCARRPQPMLQWLLDVGVLGALIPELEATVALSQEGGRRHKDVWEHTKTVVWQAVPRPEVRWAALLHDIGKVPTRKFLSNGKVTFHGHAEVGRRMFRKGPARTIGFPPEVKARVEFLILHHLRPGQYAPSWTDAAVRRFAREMGEGLTDLLDLGRADVTSRRPGKRKSCLRQISALSVRIRALAAEDAVPRPLPSGLGSVLMRSLELPPGKHLALLRQRLEALCLAGELEHDREPEYYVEAVRRLALLDGVEIHVARRGRASDTPAI